MAALIAAAPLIFSGTATAGSALAAGGAAAFAGTGAVTAATFAAPTLAFGGFSAGTMGFLGASLGIGATTLESIATGVSALGSLFQGVMQFGSMEARAEQERFNARQELIAGKSDAVRALRATNEAVAANTVAGGASGIGVTGSVQAAIANARAEGNRQLSTSRENAELNAATRRQSARGIRADGRASLFEGVLRGAGTVGDTFLGRVRRG